MSLAVAGRMAWRWQRRRGGGGRGRGGGKEEEEDVERLVDSSDNEFVISNPKSGTMELQQDLRLISDLVIILVSAAIGALVFTLMGQPLITGYLIAGSFVGPGGMGLVVELVQVSDILFFPHAFLSRGNDFVRFPNKSFFSSLFCTGGDSGPVRHHISSLCPRSGVLVFETASCAGRCGLRRHHGDTAHDVGMRCHI